MNALTHSSRAFPAIGVFAIGLACLLSGPLHAQDSSESNAPLEGSVAPLQGLLVTGGCCHDYPNQTTILCEAISQRFDRPVEWTVENYGSKRVGQLDVYSDPNWAEPYDFVIHNECYGGVEDPAVINRIVDGHLKSKVPAIAIHCSMHSYRGAANADRWRSLLGVTSTFHEKAKRPLQVVNKAPDHSAMKQFPKEWKTPNGELYIILKTWPTAKVLATAYSNEQEADQPVIWTNELSGVRVFGISLGHHNETMSSEEYLDVTAAGLRWAMTKD